MNLTGIKDYGVCNGKWKRFTQEAMEWQWIKCIMERMKSFWDKAMDGRKKKVPVK